MLFFLFFQFVNSCIFYVRHDKYVHKICSNKWKTSCNGLKFQLKSQLFDKNFKIHKFIRIYKLLSLLGDEAWFLGYPMTASIFAPFWYINLKLKIGILKIKARGSLTAVYFIIKYYKT